MWNKHEIEPNDRLKDYYRVISDGMNPPSELVNRVKGGTTVKLLAKSVHIKRFARAAACYVIGIGLFLGAIALVSGLWERSEPLATQRTTLTTAQTTAPSNPEPAPDILLSSLYEGKTVTEIEVWHPFYMNAMYTISDEDMVNAVLSELAVTNASASNHYRYFQQDLFIKLKFADGGLGEFEFAYESGKVNYSVRDANGYPNVKGYQVSDAALEKLKAVVNAQIQLALPTQKYPAPEEYLGGEIAEATLRYRYKYGGDNRVLNDVQITAIVEGLKTILTGLPLSTEPVLMGVEYYDVELIDRNGDQVRIRLYYNTGELIVEWNSKNALAGAYNFKIPVVNAREYAFWLDRYYKGESVSEFPTLEYYLNQRTCSYFLLYDSCDSEQWLYLSKDDTVEEQLYSYIRNLNFTLVSEDIPSDEPMPDGRKLVLTTSYNADQLVFELDSSGKVNCQLLDGYWKYPLFAAQYSLSAEEYAGLVAYINQLINADA